MNDSAAERAVANWIGHSKVAKRALDIVDEVESRRLATEVRFALREAYMAGVRYQRRINTKRVIK